MYNLNKRSYFTTLGELRLLLANYPDDTRIYACGADDSFLHIDDEGHFVSIDYDALDSDYDESFPAVNDYTSLSEEQYALMMIEHKARLAVLQSNKKGGKTNMRTWRLTCSIDAVNIDYEEIITSETEPDYWTCYAIAEDHGCEFFNVTEVQ